MLKILNLIEIIIVEHNHHQRHNNYTFTIVHNYFGRGIVIKFYGIIN